MRTAESIIRESEARIKMGVNIARSESLKESEEAFKRVMPDLYKAFYDYVDKGIDNLSSYTVTTEEMECVENPLIPTSLSFHYNMLEHLHAYNCTYDKETRGRLEDFFEFLYGFEEVGFGVYVKLQDNYVFIVDTIRGTVYKKKFKGLKYIGIDRNYYYITGVYEDGTTETLTDAYMDISKSIYDERKHTSTKGKWYRTGKQLKKGYIRIQHRKIYFREHTLIMGLVHGIEVAKHLVGRDCFITIDHINGIAYDNRIENLRIVTRKDNDILKNNKSHPAYDYLPMYKKMKSTYKDYKLL